jgi:glyoxylase-like metal-dependent hydrolase (beta-lactamase superfamily II)
VFRGTQGFPGGVLGNTRKDPKAFASLIHDVETKIFDILPDETWVYLGHGNDTTLGAERARRRRSGGATVPRGRCREATAPPEPHLPEWHARGW